MYFVKQSKYMLQYEFGGKVFSALYFRDKRLDFLFQILVPSTHKKGKTL